MQRSRSRKLARVRAAAATTPAGALLLRRAPVAAAVVAAIQAAHAQEAAPAASPPAGALEEVVVTASKRSENLQDVPISVQALDTKKLEEMNAQSFNDYAQQIPTIAFQTLQPGFSRTFMRGIASDNNPNHSGPLPTVGTYLDEQPITTIQGPLDLHVYDIARVEVLPGPQGTLYGASSEAGTIRLITNKPDPSRFSAGYDLQGNTIKNGTAGYIAEGFVNIPLSTDAAVRLVGWYEHDSGYLNNVPGTLTYPGAPPTYPSYTLNNSAIAANHYNPVTTYGGRAALKLDLNDNWTITPAVISQRTYWDGIFGQENWYALQNGSPIPGDLSVKHFYPEGGQDSWVDLALTVQGKIGNFDITYAGAYLKRNDHTQSDYSDYSLGYDSAASYWPPNPTQLIYGADRYEMFSNELRLTSPKEYPVRFVLGLFQQRQIHNIEQNYIINGLNPIYWVGAGPFPFPTTTPPPVWPNTWWLTQQQRVNRDSAVFGELNWDITSKLTITGGFRHYTYKNTLQGYYGFNSNVFGGTEGVATCFDPYPFQGAPCTNLDKRADGNGWTPKVNLSYKITPEAMVYATYSKGFRPGGVNRVGQAPPYAADFLKNYEVGWKTQWFNNTLRWNGALYYDQWDDFQFSFLGPNSVTIVANAGQARVKGGDMELEWQATPAFNLSLGAAYTDAYLSANYCGALDANGNPVTSNPCPAIAGGNPTPYGNLTGPYPPLAPTGQQLPNTPKFKGTVTARYNFPVGSWEGHVQANYVYQTDVWADMRTYERGLLGVQPAFGIFNFFTGIQKNNLSLELLIKNAFDERASIYRYSECTQAVCAPIAVYNVIAPPRLIGLQLSQRFF